jgi:hypothetical protein
MTKTERRLLLDRIFQLFEAGDETNQQAALNQEMTRLVDRYREGLPVAAVSRCPHSGSLLNWAIDTMGLDGLWWNSDSPIRPIETPPATFFALCGAMQLASPVEPAPFIAEPGPGRPFVVPRLLEYRQIKAVLSTLPIGPHTGYVITYFADPMLYTEERLSDWGSNHYQYTDESGTVWTNPGPVADARDFDLAPWITSGQLLWIRPGDASLTLRSDLETCPFLDLPGVTQEQFVQNGRAWQLDESTANGADYPLSEDEVNRILESIQQGG